MRYGSAQDFMRIPVLGLRAEASAIPPADPVVGQQWTDTSTDPAKFKWWDGSKWVAADGTSIPPNSVTNSHINANAAIALSKLATDPLERTNHTGTQPASTIDDFNAQVRTNRLDQLANPTLNVDFNGVRATNLAMPVAATDAANKAYVDNARAGINVKDPVRVVAGGNINLSSPGGTIDGVTLNEGDRFLAAAQNVGTQNGIYVFHGGTTAATRATDADSPGTVVDGSMLAVADGTSAGHQYIQVVASSGAPGSWTQEWIVFTMGGQTYTAGNGLVIDGTEFSLAGPVSVANGGTGAATPLQARTNLGAAAKFAADLGSLAAGVTLTVNHGLETTDVVVSFKTTDTGRSIDFDWATTGANTIAVYPDISFSAGSVRAVVIG